MAERRRITMYRAISRSFLLWGGERELVIFLLFSCAAILFSGMSWMTTIISITVGVLGIFLLRKMAKNDPLLTKVFRRYWNSYRQTYFAPNARLQGQGHSSRKQR